MKTNEIYVGNNVDVLKTFVQLLGPFIPHVAEEIWQRLGQDQSITYEPWPNFDENSISILSRVKIPSQILIDQNRPYEQMG